MDTSTRSFQEKVKQIDCNESENVNDSFDSISNEWWMDERQWMTIGDNSMEDKSRPFRFECELRIDCYIVARQLDNGITISNATFRFGELIKTDVVYTQMTATVKCRLNKMQFYHFFLFSSFALNQLANTACFLRKDGKCTFVCLCDAKHKSRMKMLKRQKSD